VPYKYLTPSYFLLPTIILPHYLTPYLLSTNYYYLRRLKPADTKFCKDKSLPYNFFLPHYLTSYLLSTYYYLLISFFCVNSSRNFLDSWLILCFSVPSVSSVANFLLFSYFFLHRIN